MTSVFIEGGCYIRISRLMSLNKSRFMGAIRAKRCSQKTFRMPREEGVGVTKMKETHTDMQTLAELFLKMWADPVTSQTIKTRRKIFGAKKKL